MKVTAISVIVLALLLAGIPTSVGLLELKLQRRPKSLKEYLYHARQVSAGNDGPPWAKDIGMSMSSDYYANIAIGTPPQLFSVLLRTDTTGLWVPSAQCPTKVYDMCRDHRRYDRGKSKTYVREGQMMGYGGMVAELSYDTVRIANQSITGQSFAEAFQYHFNDSSIPYDGLLGMDLGRVFSNDASIFTNMESQQIIPENIYGLYFLKNSPHLDKSGGLILGGRDESLYENDLTYVNSSYSVIWQFPITDVLILGSDMPPLCKDSCSGVPGTGSHFIISSHEIMDTLHRTLGATVFADDHTYHFDCNTLDSLRSVYFRVEETLLEIPWQSYVDRVVGPLGDIVCLSSFMGTEDLASSDGFFLGDAFFTSVYVEFDVDRERMGFSQLRPSY